MAFKSHLDQPGPSVPSKPIHLHQQRPSQNKPSKLLSDEENERVFQILGAGKQTLSTAPGQIFVPDEEDPSSWNDGENGVICCVRDGAKKCYFVAVVSIQSSSFLFKHTISPNISIQKLEPTFLSFEGEADTFIGLRFDDPAEAAHFQQSLQKVLEYILKTRGHSESERGNNPLETRAEKHPQVDLPDSGSALSRQDKHPQPSSSTKLSILAGTFKNLVSKDRKGKTWRQQTPEIGRPSNPVHVTNSKSGKDFLEFLQRNGFPDQLDNIKPDALELLAEAFEKESGDLISEAYERNKHWNLIAMSREATPQTIAPHERETTPQDKCTDEEEVSVTPPSHPINQGRNLQSHKSFVNSEKSRFPRGTTPLGSSTNGRSVSSSPFPHQSRESPARSDNGGDPSSRPPTTPFRHPTPVNKINPQIDKAKPSPEISLSVLRSVNWQALDSKASSSVASKLAPSIENKPFQPLSSDFLRSASLHPKATPLPFVSQRSASLAPSTKGKVLESVATIISNQEQAGGRPSPGAFKMTQNPCGTPHHTNKGDKPRSPLSPLTIAPTNRSLCSNPSEKILGISSSSNNVGKSLPCKQSTGTSQPTLTSVPGRSFTPSVKPFREPSYSKEVKTLAPTTENPTSNLNQDNVAKLIARTSGKSKTDNHQIPLSEPRPKKPPGGGVGKLSPNFMAALETKLTPNAPPDNSFKLEHGSKAPILPTRNRPHNTRCTSTPPVATRPMVSLKPTFPVKPQLLPKPEATNQAKSLASSLTPEHHTRFSPPSSLNSSKVSCRKDAFEKIQGAGNAPKFSPPMSTPVSLTTLPEPRSVTIGHSESLLNIIKTSDSNPVLETEATSRPPKTNLLSRRLSDLKTGLNKFKLGRYRSQTPPIPSNGTEHGRHGLSGKACNSPKTRVKEDQVGIDNDDELYYSGFNE